MKLKRDVISRNSWPEIHSMELVYQVSRFRENIQDDLTPTHRGFARDHSKWFIPRTLSIHPFNKRPRFLSFERSTKFVEFRLFFFFIGLVKYQANLHIDDQGSLEISQDILIDVGCLRSYYNVLIDSRPLMLANLHNTTAGIRLNRG